MRAKNIGGPWVVGLENGEKREFTGGPKDERVLGAQVNALI